MKVSFISLGCAKNLVNTEQMMALCREAGIELQEQPEGADAVVINTCGFIDSAKAARSSSRDVLPSAISRRFSTSSRRSTA